MAVRHARVAPERDSANVLFNITDELHDRQSPVHAATFSHSRLHPCEACTRWAEGLLDRLAAGGYSVVHWSVLPTDA